MESLPCPPKWYSTIMDIPGGTTKDKESRRFFFRKAHECFEYEFGHPMFQEHIELRPYRRYLKATGERLVDQPMSANLANALQVRKKFPWLFVRENLTILSGQDKQRRNSWACYTRF